MEDSPENKVMAMNVEAAHRFKSIGSKLRPLVRSSKDGSCRVFCRRCFIIVLLVAVVLLSSIIYAIYHYVDTQPDICHSKECLRSAAAFKQNMDLRMDPCEDFYSYVCGNWADDHPRPESHGSYSWYAERQVKIYRNVRAYLERNITRADPKPVAQAKAMYKACLDEDAREERGFKAVTRYLKEFGLPKIPTLLNPTIRPSKQNLKFDWINSVAKIQRTLGINVIIGFDIVQDHVNRSRNRLSLEYHYSPGDLDFPAYEWSKLKVKGHNRKDLAVPTEDDGVEDEEDGDSVSIEEMAEDFLEMLSAIDPTIEIDDMKEKMLFLATQFTEFYNRLPDRLESDGENIGYYTLQELQRITDAHISPREPLLVWQRYMDILFAGLPEGIPNAEDKLQIDDVDIEYLKRLIDVMSREKPAQIELYIWGKVVSFLVTNEFSRADGEERCAGSVLKLMGLAVSYAIADKDFLIETKPRIERMLRDIRTEFDQMVLKTDWMDAYTKYATLEKSKATESLIGFPEWILDVEKLEQHYRGVSDNRHLENWVNVVRFLIGARLRLWRVSNDHLWDMDPTEVNAANVQERNAINIPIAIIQYPFYYLGLEALNYGALGEILGHELTHGFDDSGVHYDKHGNLKRWWSMHTLQEYDERAACFVQQYSRYYVPEAKGFVDGNLTLGENIADNGGLREAFHAYRAYVKKHGPEPILPGFEQFTHEQLLFLSFGNQNCETLPPSASKRVLEDEHSPSKFRVQGVLSNMEEFSEAFKCPLGSGMNPKDKCRIW